MKNVLIIHDISSFGKCSTTVALPIISVMGSTGVILPTSILSTHTGTEFPGFVGEDLFNQMKASVNHWKNLGLKFDALYTGYLGQVEHVDFILDHVTGLLKEDATIIIDPAFADHGNYYPGFDDAYAKAQAKLLAIADYAIPNLSEACLMLGIDFNSIDPENTEQVQEVLKALQKAGAKNAIVTGVRNGDQIGATLLDENSDTYSAWADYYPQNFHGTGDIWGSVFVGQLMKSNDPKKAIDQAVDFIPKTIYATINDEDSITYGVHFEKVLGELVK